MKGLLVVIFALASAGAAEAQFNRPSPQFQAMMDLVAALRAKDVPKAMTFVADDVVVFPPRGEVISGRTQVEAALKDFVAKNAMELKFGSLGSSAAADLGYDSGVFEWALRPAGADKKTEGQGKYVAVLRQDKEVDGGRWRLIRLMWNAGPPSAP